MDYFSTRFNSYCFGKNYTGVYSFDDNDTVKIEKDKAIALVPIRKSMLFRKLQVTTANALASAKCDIYLANCDIPDTPLFEPYNQLDVATTGTKEMVQKTAITKKLKFYTIYDIIHEFGTSFKEPDWNFLSLVVKFSGAVIPASFPVTIEFELIGIDGSGWK